MEKKHERLLVGILVVVLLLILYWNRGCLMQTLGLGRGSGAQSFCGGCGGGEMAAMGGHAPVM